MGTQRKEKTLREKTETKMEGRHTEVTVLVGSSVTFLRNTEQGDTEIFK